MGTMSILNHAAVEALCSASYMENFLDSVESMPDELQRSVSCLRELDCKTAVCMKDLSHHQDAYLSTSENQQKKKSLIQIQRALVRCQEIGDEKLQIVAQIIESVESRARQLQQDRENLDPGSTDLGTRKEETRTKKDVTPITTNQSHKSITPASSSTNSNSTANTPAAVSKVNKVEERPEKLGTKRQRRQRIHQDNLVAEEEKKNEEKEKPKKKRRRKAKKEKEEDKQSKMDALDLDEPTYCLCDRISYGEMVGCDNDDCVIEWFHFNCVGLVNKPKGKWFCPNCRGDKSNVRKQEK